jgi:hypothetical protein
VRQALLALSGVEEVWASSAWQQVQVTYDPATLSPDDLSQALEHAGYPIGDGTTAGNGHKPSTASPASKDPAWDVLGVRVTETNRVDLEMSGEFRHY